MLRSSLKSFLSLLAAFAVLLGALEHEDLILNDSPTQPHVADADHSPAESLSADDTDSGTEGTFRGHLSRLWLSPPAAASTPLPISIIETPPRASAVRDQRLALAAHLALRL